MSTKAPASGAQVDAPKLETTKRSASGKPGRGFGLARPFVSERTSDRESRSSTQNGPRVKVGSSTQAPFETPPASAPELPPQRKTASVPSAESALSTSRRPLVSMLRSFPQAYRKVEGGAGLGSGAALWTSRGGSRGPSPFSDGPRDGRRRHGRRGHGRSRTIRAGRRRQRRRRPIRQREDSCRGR